MIGAQGVAPDRRRRRALGLLLAVALLVRLVPLAVADRMVVDIQRYHKVASHMLDVSWNPYQAKRLYPYPPLWVYWETASGWLERHAGLSFPVMVRLPIMAADLGIVWLLARLGRRRGLGLLPAGIYAIHPVSLLVSGFHGQFDALALVCLLGTLDLLERERRDGAALCLAVGIGLKSFPVLVLPAFLRGLGGVNAPLRFVTLAVAPVALAVLPFALNDWEAVRRELLGYGGVADFGWIGLVRGMTWIATGELPRSEAWRWASLIGVAKGLFLLTWAGLGLVAFHRRWDATRWAQIVLVAFLALYGALSAQYLLWAVPLGLLVPIGSRLRGQFWSLAFGASATLALVGFYPFLAPGVLYTAATAPPGWVGVLWVAGVGLTQLACLGWLAALAWVSVSTAEAGSTGRASPSAHPG